VAWGLIPIFFILACLQVIPTRAWGSVVAADNASNSAYAAESGGAWKGLYPTADENPPGMDNGGSGFNAWDFFGGFHQPQYSPYGRLNHFIAGVDFATTSYNNLGPRAFALTNSNFDPAACGTSCDFGGETSRATRSFVSAMAPGDTFSINFDNPHLFPEVPWFPAGFFIRLNTGNGPVVPNHPTSTATERFGFFAGTGVYGQPGLFGANWAVADAAGDTDAGVDVSATASGAQLRFTLDTDETYSMELKRRSDGALLFSRSGNLSSAGAGSIDTVEIALYGNGSGNGLVGFSMQDTGEREFYFNDLSIESAGGAILPGDYNNNGIVDAGDYVVWRDNLNTSVTLPNDTTPGTMPADYSVWRNHLGTTVGGGAGSLATTSVPEPAVLMLQALSSGLMLVSANRFRVVMLRLSHVRLSSAVLTQC
jgi:hypothetical protein